MPKELKKVEKKETASHSKLNTIRTKQNSKVLKGGEIPKSKLNHTMNLKLNLNMINKGVNNNTGNLMTPKMRKNTFTNFNSNNTNANTTGKKNENNKLLRKSETAKKSLTSNTVTNYTNNITNTTTSNPTLFTEETREKNKDNLNTNNTTEKKSNITTANKPKPHTAKKSFKSPTPTTANDRKPTLGNSASASSNSFTNLITKNKLKPTSKTTTNKSKSPTPYNMMNKSNSNSSLLTPNYLPNNNPMATYNSNSKKSLLNNKDNTSNKLFRYTEKIIKELEESKIKEDNYLETDIEINLGNNFNEDDLMIKNVEFSDLNNINDICEFDIKEKEKQNIANYSSNKLQNRLLHTATHQSHSNLKISYNTFNGKLENKKSTNPNLSPLNKSNKKSKINLTKKIISAPRPKSEVKRKDTAGPSVNNLLSNNSNKNIKKAYTLKESHSSLNNITHRREKSRPKSGFKKDLGDVKLNEASLSTEASSIFRGRFEDYAIGKEIGKGAYAIVKQGLHKPSNKKVAIKIYDKVKLLDTQRKNSVKREIQILKRLDHQNIVKLHEVIDNPKQVKIRRK
jgi:hypothetical protein